MRAARADDRPVLLSIGYSACHWCHVMERESFADHATAALMNELFVNVKVDREERPDVDQIYMRAVQAMTGGGGWPLTAFLTPDGAPFYGGTYFPPEPRHGMPSFQEVLRAVASAYQERRDEVQAAGKRMVEAMARDVVSSLGGVRAAGPGTQVTRSDSTNEPVPIVGGDSSRDSEQALIKEALDSAFRELARGFDSVHGGFGGSPKFPRPLASELLIRHHLRTGEAQALEMAVHTLRRMAAGGIRDHLAGGFHRYSVDARWLVPHFEKMLYDNALLAGAYLDAFRVTGESDLCAVCEETLDYMAGDLLSADGGFFAARDADSEGEEGVYYVWRPKEIDQALGPAAAELFKRCYDVSPAGNFEGSNILHLPHDPGAVARSLGVPERELLTSLAEARARLLAIRTRRPEPFRDEKVIAAWAALAIRAFAEAGTTLGRQDYLDVAVAGAHFVWDRMRSGDRLVRTWMKGRSGVSGFLEDYAALANALLSVHAATLDPHWLEAAAKLTDAVLGRFGDPDDPGAFFDSPTDGERLVVRARDPLDNATPSGTSLAVELLIRMAGAFGDDALRQRAMRVLARHGPALLAHGGAFGRMLSAADRVLAEPVEVVIVPGDERDREAELALVRAAHSVPARNLTVVGGPAGSHSHTTPLLENRGSLGGLTTAYVCRNRACRLPVTSPEDVSTEVRTITTGVAAAKG